MSQSHSVKAAPPVAKDDAGAFVLDEAGFDALIRVLEKEGLTPIGPTVRDGAVVYETIGSSADFPRGLRDEQTPGGYRLVKGTDGAWFDYTVGPSSWKRFIFPPRHKMWAAERDGTSFRYKKETEEVPAYAFIGVRPCELMAMQIQDKVFGYGYEPDPLTGHFTDPVYAARREKAFVLVMNCGRAGKTCFCVSMGGDPGIQDRAGYDLAMTEVVEGKKHHFIVHVGSERGAAVIKKVQSHKAAAQDLEAEAAILKKARGQMGRKMVEGVKELLQSNLHHPQWDHVAERCLSCANCTMVCPTCFCSTVEEVTDLKGDHAERWRTWDSCFSLDFSYIHGGPIRGETRARYRQWMTHKLANWQDQFGSSGCVGCGRCITWCPAGIDITEEAAAIKAQDGLMAAE